MDSQLIIIYFKFAVKNYFTTLFLSYVIYDISFVKTDILNYHRSIINASIASFNLGVYWDTKRWSHLVKITLLIRYRTEEWTWFKSWEPSTSLIAMKLH